MKKNLILLSVALLILTGCRSKNDLIGVWKLKSSKESITLENGVEFTPPGEIKITDEVLSEDGSCGGETCKEYIYSTEFGKTQIYFEGLCFELSNENELKQIECYSDKIIGLPNWENDTEHDIVYKKIK